MTERDLFLALLDLPDTDSRSAFLDNACAGDAALRARIETLLKSQDAAGSFLDQPALQSAPVDPAATQALGVNAAPQGREEADDNDLTFLAAATRPDSLGRIGHYEVLQILGRGGFGIVFRAFDEVLQRVVALKVMTPQLAATSPARKRFLREARSSAQVRHENVVQVYEVAEQPLPYLAMEFIAGETLQQRLDRIGPVEPAEVVRIGRQIAEGLAAAHAMDLIHRDIKPGNVLLESGQQRVKITDFGLARTADDASISQSGLIAGTPMYMAPEQAKGETLDHRADLFSLGSVLYVMAAGRPPFRATGMLGVLKRVAEDTPRPIREIIPETPQWLCDIIAKLHAKDPDDRYQSAREVADVLADCEAQLKANARLKDFSRIPQSKPVSRQRRSGLMLVVMLLVAFLGLGVIGSGAVFAALWLFTPFYGVGQSNGSPEVTNMAATSGADPAPLVASKQNPPPPTFKNGIGMEFVIVPKGKSWLGGSKDKQGDQEVEIPADFYLGKYEVTQEEWQKVMGENPSHFSRTGGGKDAVKNISDADLKRFPVEWVRWDQCQLFVGKLNKWEKETSWVYRLPTEVEWEYACRGGPMEDRADSAFDFYFAGPTNTLLPEQANFAPKEGNGVQRTCKVGSYQPNRLGLYDMHGNVEELCDDADKAGDVAALRMGRGGSWFGLGWYCRALHRQARPSDGEYSWGMRLARVPSGAPSPVAKTPPPAVAPFTDADVERITALPAEQQVEEVRKELMRRNSGFDGALTPAIENGVVTGLKFTTDEVVNIAPVRALKGLTSFDCRGTYLDKGKLSDLSPLKGMALNRLDCSSTRVSDLSPLAGMPLAILHFNHDPASDLTPLKGMPLLTLGCAQTKVADFSPLKGMKLESLWAMLLPATDLTPLEGLPLKSLDLYHTTGVTTLRPLKDMPLENLNLQDVPVSDLSALKGMKSLRSLHLQGNPLSDLTPLQGLKLRDLDVLDKEVSDLSPLKGMPLKRLHIYGIGVSDLRPLEGMELEEIRLTPGAVTQGLDVLRDMKSLKTIGIDGNHFWPPGEFWDRYDRGEFK